MTDRTAHPEAVPAASAPIIPLALFRCLFGCLFAALAAGCAQTGGTQTGAADTNAAQNRSPRPVTSAATEDRAPLVTEIHGATIVHDDWADLGYRWDWATVPYIDRGAGVEHLDSDRGHVFTMDSNSWLTTIDASSGRRIWQLRVADRLSSFLDTRVVGDRTVLVTSRSRLHGFDIQTGNRNLNMRPELVSSTEPLMFGPVYVSGSPSGRVQGHRILDNAGEPLTGSLRDGLPVWQYRIDGAVRAAPVDVGGVAAFVSQNGQILFVDPTTGSATGRGRIAGGMSTDPVTDGRVLYIASEDQSVYAYTPDGSRLWRYRTPDPLRTQPMIHDGALYLTIPSEGFVALDASSGERRWANDRIRGEAVAVRAGELIVWDHDSRIVRSVQPSTGDVIAEAELAGYRDMIASEPVDGRLYALAESGAIVAFIPR